MPHNQHDAEVFPSDSEAFALKDEVTSLCNRGLRISILISIGEEQRKYSLLIINQVDYLVNQVEGELTFICSAVRMCKALWMISTAVPQNCVGAVESVFQLSK